MAVREYGPLVWSALALMGFSFLIMPAVSRSAVLENASGVALLLAALFASIRFSVSEPSKLMKAIGNLGQVSLGVYFSHLLIIKFGEVVLQRTPIAGTWSSVLLLMLVATIAATTLSLFAAKFKPTRWLVG